MSLSRDDELAARRNEQIISLQDIKARIHSNHRDKAVMRVEGPMQKLFDRDCSWVPYSDRRHPVAPEKRLYNDY